IESALAGDGWKESVDRTRGYGMNKVRFYAYTGGGRKDSSAERAKLRQNFPDIAYYRKLDEIVGHMASRDVIADLILFSKDYRFSKDEEDEHGYVRYMVARYAAFPNVAWCVTNEWNYTPRPIEYWNRIGRLIRAEDPWSDRSGRPRMLSIHQQTRWD